MAVKELTLTEGGTTLYFICGRHKGRRERKISDQTDGKQLKGQGP